MVIKIIEIDCCSIDLSPTPTPSVTPTLTPTNTLTPTATTTNTNTPTVTPTNTISPTNTASPTNTITQTVTNTPTKTNTPTITSSNTNTPTNTATNTITPTVTATPSFTPSNTRTPTITPTNTATPTVTKTATVTPTNTVTNTPTVTPSNGFFWIARETNRNWKSITGSSDGTKLAAVVYGGQIYTSTDSGVSWTARESNRNWTVITSSSNGTKLAAVVYGGQIYTSIDSGVTWIARENNRDWLDITTDDSGSVLFAVDGSYIYRSFDFGITWGSILPTGAEPTFIRISASIGNTIAAIQNIASVVGGPGRIYISYDHGNSWDSPENNRYWENINIKNLFIATTYDKIYTSIYGDTWLENSTPNNFYKIITNDSQIIGISIGGQIYTSTNGGFSWTARENNRLWAGITSNSDGTKLAAVVYGGQIYTYG